MSPALAVRFFTNTVTLEAQHQEGIVKYVEYDYDQS